MVAYSFKPRFVAPIQAGTKRQTIRLPRRGRARHARPGELTQLYTGMRTRACRKIVPDVVCESVVPVRFDLRPWIADRSPRNLLLFVDGVLLGVERRETFARADGFDSFDDMVRFWLAEHGAVLFEGVCIRWRGAEHA